MIIFTIPEKIGFELYKYSDFAAQLFCTNSKNRQDG